MSRRGNRRDHRIWSGIDHFIKSRPAEDQKHLKNKSWDLSMGSTFPLPCWAKSAKTFGDTRQLLPINDNIFQHSYTPSIHNNNTKIMFSLCLSNTRLSLHDYQIIIWIFLFGWTTILATEIFFLQEISRNVNVFLALLNFITNLIQSDINKAYLPLDRQFCLYTLIFQASQA